MEELIYVAPAKRYNKGVMESRPVSLARETPYTLFVNDEEILTIATLPVRLEELFVGFLVAEGVLQAPEEIVEIQVDQSSRIVRMDVLVPDDRLTRIHTKGMLTSGCAGGVLFSTETALETRPDYGSPRALSAESVIARMRELDTHSGIYSRTRGVHAASLADQSRTIVTMEDLGRHNAIDKVVGYCFLNRIATGDKLLLTTGRITSEAIIKTDRAGFPIIISRSSASALAVRMAGTSRIDVITYVRGGRFNYFPNGRVRLA